MPKLIPKELVTELCLAYQRGEPSQKIAKRLDIASVTVRRHLRKNNIPIRKTTACRGNFLYHHNRHYFDELNQPDKAYWLGFLAADGNVYKDYVHLELQIKDKAHIERFRESLDSTHPIRIRHSNNVHSANITIHSKFLSTTLAKWNVVPAKSKILKFPSIDHHLLSHYIRGFVDGDGGWHIRPRPHRSSLGYIFHVSCGSLDFMQKLQEHLVRFCGLNFVKITKSDRWHVYRFAYQGRQQLQRVVKFIYQGATIYLPRKWEIARRFLYIPAGNPVDIYIANASEQLSFWS